MRFFSQLGVLLRMNLLSLPQRPGLAFTTVIGIACAVGVMVSMLAMGTGARRAAMGNVRPDRASLLSVGAPMPEESSIPQSSAVLIQDLPGIRRAASGEPVAVPQVLVYPQARRKSTGTRETFSLMGAGARLTDYAPELHLTAGRMFRPGLRELIATNSCARQYEQFSLGDTRVMQGYDWRIVGTFDLGNPDGWCIAYADQATVLSTFRRDSYNQVDVMLQSPSAFDTLRKAVTANPQLRLQVRHEAELAEQYTRQINGILNFVSYFVGTILAVAAVIAACNSLYAMVDNRRREIATLRAIGFSGLPVIVSTLSEAMLLAVPGALIGAGLAWLLFNGRAGKFATFQFHLAVTPYLALLGIGWALGMGLVGGILPAVRAARVPVTVALRAT